MTDFSIRVDARHALRTLGKARDRAGNLKPVWGDINANVIQPAMQRRFDLGGAYLGAPWRPLSPGTRASRIRRGGNRGGINRPLWDTNRLRRSWIKRSGESVIAIEDMRLERGVVVPYAQYHQEGTGRLPQREMVTEQLAEHVGEEAAKRIARYVTEG